MARTPKASQQRCRRHTRAHTSVCLPLRSRSPPDQSRDMAEQAEQASEQKPHGHDAQFCASHPFSQDDDHEYSASGNNGSPDSPVVQFRQDAKDIDRRTLSGHAAAPIRAHPAISLDLQALNTIAIQRSTGMAKKIQYATGRQCLRHSLAESVPWLAEGSEQCFRQRSELAISTSAICQHVSPTWEPGSSLQPKGSHGWRRKASPPAIRNSELSL